MPAMVENYICQKKCDGELLMHASSTCLCDGFVHTCQVHLESIVSYVSGGAAFLKLVWSRMVALSL
jgi:hypothetical protein